MLAVTAFIIEKLSIILHDEKDAFASIILKEDCHEVGKTHQETCIRRTGRT
jgi:hypothetical protein